MSTSVTVTLLEARAAERLAIKLRVRHLMLEFAIKARKQKPIGVAAVFCEELNIWLGVHIAKGEPAWIGFIGLGSAKAGACAMRALLGDEADRLNARDILGMEPGVSGPN